MEVGKTVAGADLASMCPASKDNDGENDDAILRWSWWPNADAAGINAKNHHTIDSFLVSTFRLTTKSHVRSAP